MSAENRKEAASWASEKFARALERHQQNYRTGMSLHEIAEAAFDAKLEAEAKFACKISLTNSVDDNWFFQ